MTGRYFQDWLLLESDWNWRLQPDRGGALRAVGDIGSHWLDLMTYVTGQHVASVMADLTTFIETRREPTGPVETFATERSADAVERRIATEDAATILLRFDGGARGAVSISQISPGRKNSLVFEIDGSDGAWGWDSEQPDQAWIGHRERPNEILIRNPALMGPAGRPRRPCPAATSRGSSTRIAPTSGRSTRTCWPGDPPPRPATPPSPTGTTRCSSARRSHAVRTKGAGWMSTEPALPVSPPAGVARMKLGFLTAPFAETPLMDVADWAAGADFEVLEIACWPRADGPVRRYAGDLPHRRQEPVGRPGQGHRRRDRCEGPVHLGARLLPEPAPPGPGASR